MVAALILAVGLLACIGVVLEYINRQRPEDTETMEAILEAERRATYKEFLPKLVALNEQYIRDVVAENRAERERQETMRLEKEGAESIRDVTAALVSMGWPMADCVALAKSAVKALGPKASIEELTIYALSHTP